MVGDEDFLPPWFLRRGWERSRAVGIIKKYTSRALDDSDDSGIGTGFLIHHSVVMTTCHVLLEKRMAESCVIQFEHEEHEENQLVLTDDYDDYLRE